MLMNSHDWQIMSPPDDAPDRNHDRIEIEDILRTMIVTEIRSGRLTPKRRKRIIQFVSHLGISPVEAGKLVQACLDEASEASNANIVSRNGLRVIRCSEIEQAPVARAIGTIRLRKQIAYFAIAAGCIMLISSFFVFLGVM